MQHNGKHYSSTDLHFSQDDQNTLTVVTQQTEADVSVDSKPSVKEDSNVDTVRDFPSHLKIKVSFLDQNDTQVYIIIKKKLSKNI